jgi:hypothetical protein
MELAEMLGGTDWLKLVLGASRTQTWTKKGIFNRSRSYVTEYLSIYYRKNEIDYKLLIEKFYLLDEQKKVKAVTLDATRYTRFSLKNIHSRFMLGNPDINFNAAETCYSLLCQDSDLRIMVEKLTGTSLQPF